VRGATSDESERPIADVNGWLRQTNDAIGYNITSAFDAAGSLKSARAAVVPVSRPRVIRKVVALIPQAGCPRAITQGSRDEPVVRGLIIEVLSDLGYKALEASDGPKGLENCYRATASICL
jgi:hypothetical protein